MPRFHLVPTKYFEEDFQNLPKKVQGQVLRALERNEADPHRGQKLVATKLAQCATASAITGFATISRPRW